MCLPGSGRRFGDEAASIEEPAPRVHPSVRPRGPSRSGVSRPIGNPAPCYALLKASYPPTRTPRASNSTLDIYIATPGMRLRKASLMATARMMLDRLPSLTWACAVRYAIQLGSSGWVMRRPMEKIMNFWVTH
jgi:hypothetical protein